MVKHLILALEQLNRQCADAVRALEKKDYSQALGAVAGLEDQFRYVSTRLTVLWELEALKTNKRKQ
jgi:hypothetical protein